MSLAIATTNNGVCGPRPVISPTSACGSSPGPITPPHGHFSPSAVRRHPRGNGRSITMSIRESFSHSQLFIEDERENTVTNRSSMQRSTENRGTEINGKSTRPNEATYQHRSRKRRWIRHYGHRSGPSGNENGWLRNRYPN